MTFCCQIILEDFKYHNRIACLRWPSTNGLFVGIKLAGFDAPESIVAQLKDGTFELTIAQHPAEIGYFGFMAAYAQVTGNPVPTAIGTGFTVMTAANIDDPKVARYLYKSS